MFSHIFCFLVVFGLCFSIPPPPHSGYNAFTNVSPQYRRLTNALSRAAVDLSYRYQCPTVQNIYYRNHYRTLLSHTVNDSFDERQYVVGAISVWKSDCVSFFNEYYFSKPTCPRLYGCGNPHISLLSHPSWITSLYMCQYYPSFSRLDFFLAKTMEYDVDARASYSVFAKLRLILYNPSNASFALTLPSCTGYYFVYFYRGNFDYQVPNVVIYDHDVCVHHSDINFLSLCWRIKWYNASDFLQFVLLNHKFSDEVNDFYCRSKTVISPVDDYVASNCTRQQLMTTPVESGCLLSYAPYPLRPDPVITCYSIHTNSYNWFTALVIGVFSYFIDPVIEMVKTMIRAMLGVICDFFSQVVITITSYTYFYEVLLLFSPINMYLFYVCRSWIFVLYVDFTVLLLYVFVMNI